MRREMVPVSLLFILTYCGSAQIPEGAFLLGIFMNKWQKMTSATPLTVYDTERLHLRYTKTNMTPGLREE